MPHPSQGVQAPGWRDPVTLLDLVLILVLPALMLIVAGVAWQAMSGAGYRRSRRVVSADPGTRVTGYAVRDTPPPPRGSTRKLRIAATLFESGCDDCGAVRGQPCRLIPGAQTAVVDSDRNWACHFSRIEKGCKNNRRLYADLIRNWEGPVPAELRGMHESSR
jgi:hypothetical protein